jgi:coenzyme F420-reducing hydrogenase gamma subunit
MGKPKVGIFGLTGCAGDQLAILDCEDQLLDLVALIDICDFTMASSDGHGDCALDIAMVEGAVLTQRDAERLRAIRKRSTTLVALGTCAVWGGVAAMDRGLDRAKLMGEVYGEMGKDYDSCPAQALHEIVKVDHDITGCPIEKTHFLSAVAALLNGDSPVYPAYPVCTECRMRENNCLLIERGDICCGAITAAGCGARCPELRIPCVGCRGPVTDGNPASMLAVFEEKGFDRRRIAARLSMFAPAEVAP